MLALVCHLFCLTFVVFDFFTTNHALLQIVTVGPAWEEAKLHEHPNFYVNSLCDLCSLIWCHLSADNRIPSGAMKLLWEDLTNGGYVALLDGFSRVPFCSTEGRALMSMDLASFSSGVCPRSVLDRMEEQSLCSLPPPQKSVTEGSSLRGMSYVDTYIKVFYYPQLVSAAGLATEIFQCIRCQLLTFFVCR